MREIIGLIMIGSVFVAVFVFVVVEAGWLPALGIFAVTGALFCWIALGCYLAYGG